MANGHKTLVFSQMTRTRDILMVDYLKFKSRDWRGLRKTMEAIGEEDEDQFQDQAVL